MILRAVFVVSFLWVGAAFADPAEDAHKAADMLEEATLSLQGATNARDRVKALTETIRAFEAGLAAMRDGLRRAARRESQLTQQLQARQGEIAELLAVLQKIETSPPPVLLLHPSGPMGAARSGMMLAEVTPAIQARADRLAGDLEEVQTLRLLQQTAVETLENGLTGAQDARAKLSKAIADRTDLPRRFTEDPVRTGILIASTETLEGFASGLAEISIDAVDPLPANINHEKGNLSFPVQGLLLRKAGEADAAGIKRDGIIIAARPRALVTTPTAATIRYRGPLLELGNVMILEPQPDMLLILSGLAEVFGEAGQVIPAGSPVGLMGGEVPEIGAILSLSGEGTGTDRSETLYIEIREGGSPVDPLAWFRTEKDE